MGYNPEKHHRHSLRLKGYDYKKPGMYFVTIPSWGRQPLFTSSEIQELLTEAWQNLPGRFPTITVGMFVVMSNHVHGTLSLDKPIKGIASPSLSAIIGAYKSITTVEWIHMNKRKGLPCSGHLWQKRFYDHVIRNDLDLQRIREYILNNPLNALIRQGEEIDDRIWEEAISQSISEYSSPP